MYDAPSERKVRIFFPVLELPITTMRRRTHAERCSRTIDGTGRGCGPDPHDTVRAARMLALIPRMVPKEAPG